MKTELYNLCGELVAYVETSAAPMEEINVVKESSFPATLGCVHLIRKADNESAIGQSETGKAHQATGAFLDNGACKDKITCRALFLRGAADSDGFNRAHALNYIQRVMSRVFATSKGKADKDNSGNGRTKTSKGNKRNNGHRAIVDAQTIEDLAQSAFIHYWQARQRGKVIDLPLACRAAIFDYLKADRKHKRACLAFKLDTMSDAHKAEREENRQAQLEQERVELSLDKSTSALLDIVRQEGNARVRTLARGLNTTSYVIRRKLAKLANEV